MADKMAKTLSKRMVKFKQQITPKLYDPQEAFDVLTKNANARESVDISVLLNIDGKKSEHVVKGLIEEMPAGLGKKITVGVFTKSEVSKIKDAGADHVGFEDLFEQVKKEEIDCDVYLATVDVMPELAKMGLGRILKGKMPNPKTGTVVEIKDIAHALKMKKAGQLLFRSSYNVVHSSIGRASFSSVDLTKNYEKFIQAIANARPSVIKPHNYFKKVFVSTTMGPSIQLNIRGNKC
jgi:large subunit ribosomal protein L1